MKYNSATIVFGLLIGIPFFAGIFVLSALFWGFLWNSLLVFVFPSLPVLDFWKSCLLALFMYFLLTVFGNK
jgi:hypothetical protein